MKETLKTRGKSIARRTEGDEGEVGWQFGNFPLSYQEAQGSNRPLPKPALPAAFLMRMAPALVVAPGT